MFMVTTKNGRTVGIVVGVVLLKIMVVVDVEQDNDEA